MAAEAGVGGGGALLVGLDLAAGSLGGLAGVIIGHPLDTVKTRMQAATSPLRSLSAWGCLTATIRGEGLCGLWRGIGPPMFAVALYQSTVFASYEWSLKQGLAYGIREDHARLAAGALSGAASCLITVPTDAVKIRLQVDHKLSNDALRCARQMVAERGVRSLFSGMSACLLRDVPATIVYFAAYREAKETLLRRLNSDSTEGCRGVAVELLAGGAAGLASWSCAAPLDVVKTAAQEAAWTGKGGGLLWAAREVVRRDGPRGFLRGAGPLIIRSFPVNAVTFVVYEQTKRLFGVPSLL